MKNKISIFLLFFLIGCKKDKTTPVQSSSTNKTTFQSEIYFYGESPIDTLIFQSGIKGGNDLAGVGTGKGNEYSSSFYFTTSSSNNINIKFVLPQTNPTLADYNTYFQAGKKYFKPENELDGVFFYRVNQFGKIFITGIGNQDSSYFNISEVGNIKFNGGNYKYIKATFDCILNNPNDSSSFHIKNGMVKCLIPLY